MAKKNKSLELFDRAIKMYELPETENSDGSVSKGEKGLSSLRDKKPLAPFDGTDSISLMSEDIVDSIIEKSSGIDYGINADPVYKYYSDYYKNEGRKNAEDAMGLASSLTGGYGNSYGMTLAGKAMAEAGEKAYEKGLELEERAYERNKDELDGLYKLLGALGDMSDRSASRNKESFDLAFKAAQSGDYSLLEKLGIDTAALKEGDVADKAKMFAEYGDYSGLSSLGIDISKLISDDERENADFSAKYGDYSGLSSMGIDISKLISDGERENADFSAKYGDYSGLKALGIDTSKITAEDKRKQAEFLANYGDYSGLTDMGVDLTKLNEKELREMAELFAKYGDYTLLSILGADTSRKEEEDYYSNLILKGRYYNL